MGRKLYNGHTIPQIQLGLYMMSGKEVLASVPWALAAGYRGFDSAQMYHNEAEAGQAIRKWLESSENTSGPNLKREDIWYTSKLASSRFVIDIYTSPTAPYALRPPPFIYDVQTVLGGAICRSC